MAIKYVGLGHAALRCRENQFETLKDFLMKDLGLKHAFDLINEHDEVWISYFRLPSGQYIEVLPETPSSPMPYFDGSKKRCDGSYYHSCFEINDRHAAVADLEEGKGITVHRTPDDSVGLCKSHCLFIHDPLGGEWELMEFTKESLQIVNDAK